MECTPGLIAVKLQNKEYVVPKLKKLKVSPNLKPLLAQFTHAALGPAFYAKWKTYLEGFRSSTRSAADPVSSPGLTLS